MVILKNCGGARSNWGGAASNCLIPCGGAGSNWGAAGSNCLILFHRKSSGPTTKTELGTTT